ncbi:MAG: N-acetyltransferase [Pirellulaceae bacterium]
MSPVTVVPARTRQQQRDFLDLPAAIYRDDPVWIPALRMNVRELVGFARHPFHEENELQAFVAYRDGRPVGRIVAIVNNAHIQRYKDRRGFFGFFESQDDQEVADGLFGTVRDWLAQRDIHDMRGPANPTLNYECGLLIDGFDTSPYFMMTHNPPYYARLTEAFGFRKTQDMYAFGAHVEMLWSLDAKLQVICEESKRRLNIHSRSMNRRRFDEEVRTFLRIYNDSLGGTWGYTPLSEREIVHLSRSLKMLIVPELSSIAEVDGKVIGASFVMLDYNPRIKQINGRLFPFGFLRLLWNKRGIKRIRLISTNVVPEYQRWGVGLVLMQNLIAPVLNWGVKDVEFSWVLETNTLSAGTLRRGGAKITKTYRLYDYGPTPDPQAYLTARVAGK